MGITRWDSAKQILTESSLDQGWFAIPDQRFKKRYRDRYLKTFNVSPNDLSSLSYDAIALIGVILEKNNSNIMAHKFDKTYFSDQNGFIGINGIFRFDHSGENERALSIAEVDSGKFKIIDQAPKSFEVNETP